MANKKFTLNDVQFITDMLEHKIYTISELAKRYKVTKEKIQSLHDKGLMIESGMDWMINKI
jgi:phage antirepressor YoqD-like protein